MVTGDRDTRVLIAFTDRERFLIREYYRTHLPPGLARKGRLPPGLQKQLHVRGRLPPGLQPHHLPRDLYRRLRPLPGPYTRLRIGTDVVLIDERSRVILDIIHVFD